jgi:hypothetical protein
MCCCILYATASAYVAASVLLLPVRRDGSVLSISGAPSSTLDAKHCFFDEKNLHIRLYIHGIYNLIYLFTLYTICTMVHNVPWYISWYIPCGIYYVVYHIGAMVYTIKKWYIPWDNILDIISISLAYHLHDICIYAYLMHI